MMSLPRAAGDRVVAAAAGDRVVAVAGKDDVVAACRRMIESLPLPPVSVLELGAAVDDVVAACRR